MIYIKQLTSRLNFGSPKDVLWIWKYFKSPKSQISEILLIPNILCKVYLTSALFLCITCAYQAKYDSFCWGEVMVSNCGSGCPGTHCIAQTALKLETIHLFCLYGIIGMCGHIQLKLYCFWRTKEFHCSGSKAATKKHPSLEAQWVPGHWMEGLAYFLCMVYTEPDKWALFYKSLEAPVC